MAFEDSDPIGEFDVIRRFFTPSEFSPSQGSLSESPIILGIGDDCALINSPPSGEVYAITSDMLVEGRHFFKDANPTLLGHKCLAVNLSDLAAMGAKPVAYNLSIALPGIDIPWLEQFSQGLHTIADFHNCGLIGGDTTAGPLTISITAFGKVNPQQALRRSGAQIGDDIWLSNTVGDARLVLGFRRGEWNMELPWHELAHRMDAPTPRIDLGLGLRGIASSAIDVSDGLLGDLGHILHASKVHANIWIDEIPCSPQLREVSLELRRLCTLKGGDDYELCFTAPQKHRDLIKTLSEHLHLPLTRIGEVTETMPDQANMTLLDDDGAALPADLAKQYMRSFDHFK
ncbi:thiamine-monophosphate kinase [Polynucleobacter sp. SHI8]|uniref:thiamine-phosphate kinase n=1 Tax=unclassified Polynucleobacter TaxID=2640945 RepID=UPI002491BFE3|nr:MULTISPECIES: thiamine-phosphate kinase [unclassified Polynucleobacter]BDW10155.1 thiamine-monophosphate kinase [Polynucleobacter sp. SHI2]BDW12601.1 thiamine-monophosphate kinase [Polynucleobacter sp. SHI8]